MTSWQTRRHLPGSHLCFLAAILTQALAVFLQRWSLDGSATKQIPGQGNTVSFLPQLPNSAGQSLISDFVQAR